jgi:uncharacterized protein (TIGR02231 family)
MRLTISLFALLLTASTAWSQNAAKATQTVQSVTLYNQGALVTVNASFDAKVGSNEVVITGVPNAIDPNTVQLTGNDAYEITGIRHEIKYGGGSLTQLGRSKRDSLENAQFTLKTKTAVKSALIEELQLIQANRKIGGENSVLIAEELEEMADFFRRRVKEINFKSLEIAEEENELRALIQRLDNELRNLKSASERNGREVVVKLNGKKAGRTSVLLTYFVNEAGWEMYYDVRSSGTGKDIELVSKARVRQATGVDWDDVTMALSTGSPSLGGSVTNLSPWRLYLYDPQPVAAKNFAGAPPMAMQESAMRSISADEMADDFESFAVVENRQSLNTLFAINTPYSISGDNRVHDVEIKRTTLPAVYRHRAVPKYGRDVFLTAEITDWDKYNLLPGEASVFFEGSYAGKSYINPGITSDTLSISMGRDRNITVDYEMIGDFSKTTTIGSKRKTTRGYRIKVQNNGAKMVDLRIEDQLPLSTSSDIEVKAEEISGANYDPVSGKLTWDIKLEPGKSQERVVRFEVIYPKKKVISGL